MESKRVFFVPHLWCLSVVFLENTHTHTKMCFSDLGGIRNTFHARVKCGTVNTKAMIFFAFTVVSSYVHGLSSKSIMIQSILLKRVSFILPFEIPIFW